MFLDFIAPAHCLFQTLSPLSLSLTLSLHLSLSDSLFPLLRKPGVGALKHMWSKNVSPQQSMHFGIFSNVFLLVFSLFIFAHLFPFSVLVFHAGYLETQSHGYLSSFCARRRDVVTMECSVACQRRHSGWTEWSNRGMRRREKRRWKIIGPYVHLQYSFTLIHYTHNMTLTSQTNTSIKKHQTSCSPCQPNVGYD